MNNQNIQSINLGFGVSIERIENKEVKIHNLKSYGNSVINLGVKFK